MEKKYEILTDTVNPLWETLHRIRALKDFGDVKKGDLGGWITSEENLSQEGLCWVYGDARVLDHAVVRDCAIVCDHVIVRNSAIVKDDSRINEYANISGHASIAEKANVSGHAKIRENASIYGYSFVHGYSVISGRATVSGAAHVYDNAEVHGNAKVFGKAVLNTNIMVGKNAHISYRRDTLSIGPIGSRDAYTTFYKTVEGIYVCCGCFNGSLEEFEQRVNNRYRENEILQVYYDEYASAIEFVKSSKFGTRSIPNLPRFRFLEDQVTGPS